MPVTPAHAAAVVPFCRWKSHFWLSPLVVGSMAPDFMYYVFAGEPMRHFGHTPKGLIVFCIPVGLAVLCAFHRFVKRPLVLLLPQPVRAKLWPYCGAFPVLPLRRLLWVCMLIFLGAVTHVVWDGFTHENDWALRGYPQLGSVMITIAGQELHWVGLLQYGSSLLGLGLLAWWSLEWYHRAPAGRAPADSVILRRSRPIIAAAIIGFGVAVGVSCGLRYAHSLGGPFNVREFAAAAFITGADAFGLALLAFIPLVNLLVWKRTPTAHEAARHPLLHDLRMSASVQAVPVTSSESS